jgi:hypothetical protein
VSRKLHYRRDILKPSPLTGIKEELRDTTLN